MSRETPEQIYNRVISSHRIYNLWANHELGLMGAGDTYSSKEILDILDLPPYRGLKGRYFRDDMNQQLQPIARSLPITTVLNYCKALMRPVYTDYTEVFENKEFSKISHKFYYHLFMQESIYVSYELFKHSEVKINTTTDKAKVEVVKSKKFDLWVKVTDDEYDDSNEFVHLDTSLVVKIHNGRERLANVRGGAEYHGNFSNGFNIAVIELLLTNYYEQCIKICGKRLEITTNTDSAYETERIEAILSNFSNIIEDNAQSTTVIRPIALMEGLDLECIRDSIYYYLDRLKYEYGRVSNTNPKGERLTSGENYKDISSIANRQKETLERLIDFSFQAKEMWNIDLQFAVSGIPEKEAIYTMSHAAQTPNEEKPYFGQVQGTGDRPGVGDKTMVRKTLKSVIKSRPKK